MLRAPFAHPPTPQASPRLRGGWARWGSMGSRRSTARPPRVAGEVGTAAATHPFGPVLGMGRRGFAGRKETAEFRVPSIHLYTPRLQLARTRFLFCLPRVCKSAASNPLLFLPSPGLQSASSNPLPSLPSLGLQKCWLDLRNFSRLFLALVNTAAASPPTPPAGVELLKQSGSIPPFLMVH